MQNEEMFRTAFLGYNKEDVRNYLQAVENNVKSLKNQFQSETDGLKREMEELKERLAKAQSELSDEEHSSLDAAEYLMQMQQLKEETKTLRSQLKETEEQLENYKSINVTVQKTQNSDLRDRAPMEKEQYEEEYHAITKVLEDARISAKKIEEDAQKRAEEILSEAQKESQALKERLKSQIDKDLEDKGIRLMAAKYKIEAYRKEINSTQQKLYNLYSDMGKMVDNMPQRLEQLWDGDAYSDLLSQDGETGKSEDNNTALDTAGEIR